MDPMRLFAFRILNRVLEEDQFMHVEFKSLFARETQLKSLDKAFIESLVRTTLEHCMEIDLYIDKVSKTKVKKLKPAIRTILRMTGAQLLFMEKIPDHAAVSEALHLTQKLKLTQLKGFVNGVLRSMIRLRDEGFDPFAGMDEKKALGLRYSIPNWMLDEFIKALGLEETKRMLAAMNEPVRISAYRNKTKLSKKAMDETGLTPLPYGLDGVYLEKADHPMIADGSFLIQDVSSMLQGAVVNAKPGNTVIDVCAAPGGKSFHAAIDMEGSGLVISRDQNEEKCSLINDGCKRLGLSNVRASVHDAALLDPSLKEKADLLICDLPCSGLGIIGRKPDIRYHVKKEDIEGLAALQRKILNTAFSYVKPGGRLIYSTCTLSLSEDEQIYEEILKSGHFERESLVPYLKGLAEDSLLERGFIKLYPGMGPFDGFFIGSVRKIEE